MVRNVCLAGLALIYCLAGTLSVAGQVEGNGALMPVPAAYSPTSVRFSLTDGFRAAVSGPCDPRLYAEATRFIRRLSERTGIFLDKQGFVGPGNSAPLLIKVLRPAKLVLHEDESYELKVGSDRVVISAPTDIGAIRGLETLLQLLSADSTGYYFQGAVIRDSPRFAWRGLLLDVALHFMPVEEIKRTLDGMAAVKMNVLHLHLCNDQGFRVESKVFPRL
ncbi:MAG TPA: family 20 glycosylhydrolase, partial [Puia sp.]|nr:family 20 glycosylhydrolase [Puia sp.]